MPRTYVPAPARRAGLPRSHVPASAASADWYGTRGATEGDEHRDAAGQDAAGCNGGRGCAGEADVGAGLCCRVRDVTLVVGL